MRTDREQRNFATERSGSRRRSRTSGSDIAAIKTGRINSERVPKHFAAGCGGELITVDEYLKHEKCFNTVFVYGVLRGGGKILERCIQQGKCVFYGDHAYLLADRGYQKPAEHAWYRVTIADHQNMRYCQRPADRWDRYFNDRIEIQDWKVGRDRIVICPPSRHMLSYYCDRAWLPNIKKAIAKYAPKKYITIREKKPTPQYRMVRGFKKKIDPKSTKIKWDAVHATVCWNSSVSIESICRGIPSYGSDYNVASLLFPSIRTIDNPEQPDRMLWLYHLSYSQFTLAEMADGTAWRILNES